MNKTRIIGIILLIIGAGINYFFENDGTDFFSGLLIGLGFGLILTGRLFNK